MVAFIKLLVETREPTICLSPVSETQLTCGSTHESYEGCLSNGGLTCTSATGMSHGSYCMAVIPCNTIAVLSLISTNNLIRHYPYIGCETLCQLCHRQTRKPTIVEILTDSLFAHCSHCLKNFQLNRVIEIVLLAIRDKKCVRHLQTEIMLIKFCQNLVMNSMIALTVIYCEYDSY